MKSYHIYLNLNRCITSKDDDGGDDEMFPPTFRDLSRGWSKQSQNVLLQEARQGSLYLIYFLTEFSAS